MTVAIRRTNTVHHWRCAYCGRTSDSSVRPGMTYGGRCPGAKNGMHRWVKER